MFLVGECGHRFCLNCVKQHIQLKLLDGKIPTCLEHWCKSQLCIDTCVKLLNPKLFLMWEQRIKEEQSFCRSLDMDIVGDASIVVAPFASTAKFHGMVRYRAPITRDFMVILEEMRKQS